MMVGSNITETNPVASLRIKEAKRKLGAKVIVVDSICTNMMKLSTHPILVSANSEAAFLQGMMRAIITNKWTHQAFMEQHPAAYETLEKTVLSFSEEALSQKSGVAWEKITEVAQLLAESKRGTLIWGEGIVSQNGGWDNLLRLIDLALLCGLLDKPGAGIHPVCEENNEQGAVDMGGVCEFLPGQVPYEEGRSRFSQIWNKPLPDTAGLALPQIIEKALKGEIKALYIVGENPLETLPASMRVREAFEKIDLIICQDPFLTRTGACADFVLPATTFAEKEGTFTNMEGATRPLNKALDPVGESRTDFKIFSDLSRQLGGDSFRSTEEIRPEMNRCVEGYFDQGLISENRNPEKRLNHLHRYFANGFSTEATKRYTNQSAASDLQQDSSTMRLVLGQMIYHSGKLSTRDEGLMKIYDKPTLRISEADATVLELKNKEWIRVTSPHASVELGVEIMPSLPKGTVWFPEHFTDLKDLMQVTVDSITHVPYFKSGEVSLKKVPLFDLTVIASKTAGLYEVPAMVSEEKPFGLPIDPVENMNS